MRVANGWWEGRWEGEKGRVDQEEEGCERGETTLRAAFDAIAGRQIGCCIRAENGTSFYRRLDFAHSSRGFSLCLMQNPLESLVRR